MEYREIEVRFLEIDKDALLAKLRELGAEDLGEDLLDEKIIYDDGLTWRDSPGTFMRLRTRNGKTALSYKHRTAQTVDGTEEIEFEVSDPSAAEALLNRLGYHMYRTQQKKRHTFKLGEVTVDIDTWPRVPTYVELEGFSESALREAAEKLNLDWETVELRNPRKVIEEVYGISVGTMTWFTFDKFE
jgi:adenylate cyclase class 2